MARNDFKITFGNRLALVANAFTNLTIIYMFNFTNHFLEWYIDVVGKLLS